MKSVNENLFKKNKILENDNNNLINTLNEIRNIKENLFKKNKILEDNNNNLINNKNIIFNEKKQNLEILKNKTNEIEELKIILNKEIEKNNSLIFENENLNKKLNEQTNLIKKLEIEKQNFFLKKKGKPETIEENYFNKSIKIQKNFDNINLKIKNIKKISFYQNYEDLFNNKNIGFYYLNDKNLFLTEFINENYENLFKEGLIKFKIYFF
jgi:hypothetical protein